MLIEVGGREIDVDVDNVHVVKVKGKQYCYYPRCGKGKKIRLDVSSLADFFRSFDEAKKDYESGVFDKKFSWIIKEYKESGEFKNLRPKSKKAYISFLKTIVEEFGHCSIMELESPDFRRKVLKFRDTLYHQKAKGDSIVKLIRIVLSWAKDRNITKYNHFTGISRIYKPDRSDMVWTGQDIQNFYNAAPPPLQNVFLMTYFTGQRIGDILKLKWDQIITEDNGDRFIRIKQEKTGVKIDIYVNKPIDALLNRIPKNRETVLTTKNKSIWEYDDFNRLASSITQKHVKKPLHIHDLRGTFMSDLKDIGLTVPQISVISGHVAVKGTEVVQGYLSKNLTEEMKNASKNTSKEAMLLHEKILLKKGCFTQFLQQ